MSLHKHVWDAANGTACGSCSERRPYIHDLDKTLAQVREEVYFATEKFGKFASPHEGYAIIKEEVDELWEEVKRNNGYEQNAKNEAIQVAAMAVRYLIDISRKGIDTHG